MELENSGKVRFQKSQMSQTWKFNQYFQQFFVKFQAKNSTLVALNLPDA
jgi:hypothetical protein